MYIFVIALTLGAAYTDLLKGKIYNKYLMGFMAAGLLLSLVTRGFLQTAVSFLLAAAAFVILIPVYMVRGLGGGDVKLIAVSALFLARTDLMCVCAIAFLISVTFGLLRMILKRIKGDRGLTTIAFAVPFMMSAAFNLVKL